MMEKALPSATPWDNFVTLFAVEKMSQPHLAR